MRYDKKELDEAIAAGKWPPKPVWCVECGTKLRSKFPGEFVQCKCGKAFADQTPHYHRYGGEITDVKPKKTLQK